MKNTSLLILFCSILNADIDVLVSNNNKLNNATKNELANVYLKKTDKIKGKKVIAVNNKDDYNEFNKKVLNKTPNQIHAYWMKQIFLGKKVPPKNITQKDVKKEISNNPNTVTYTSIKSDEKVIYETK
ncbi:MAG: hypothetical protein DRG78_16210 [Epsilonproteobacteria bacterium]|nr:MAG: hypothetical protein DRG78_16210 [Campylobacterota bacterium]